MSDLFIWTGLEDVRKRAEASATHEHVKILLTGEVGTGKGRIAQFIHDQSPRHLRPLRRQNCAGLQEALLESELFGYAKGAFTGADKDKLGLVSVAEGGTLFLDEVQALAPRLQEKLLVFLEEGHFRRVGETNDCHANVRIICATSVLDLGDNAVFPSNFLTRIAQYVITIPALRERKQAVPEIARHWLTSLHGRDNRVPVDLDGDALEALLGSDFPGNIRGLENLLTQAGINHGIDNPERELITRSDLIRAGLKPVSLKRDPITSASKRPILSSTDEGYELVARTAESLDGYWDHASRQPAFGPAVIHGALVFLDDLSRNTGDREKNESLLYGLTVRPQSPGYMLIAYALAVAIRVDMSKTENTQAAATLARYSSSFDKGRHKGDFLALVSRLVGPVA